MCNPLEKQKQPQHVVLTATQQLQEERKERTMTSPEAFEQKFDTLKEQILSYRREQYEMGQVKDLVLERNPTQKRQPAPPVSKLTDRQRRKIESKRKNNLKKARRKRIPGASADTLPMQEAVKGFYKDIAKNGIQNPGTFGFDAKLFSPDFPEEQECSIDVKKGMTTLMKLKKAKADFDADHSGLDDFKVIASRTNFLLMDPLENALRTLLAANGIDMATGALIRDEQVVAEAQQMQREAIAAYERAMANVSSTFGDVMEEHFADRLAEEKAKNEYSDKEMLKGYHIEEYTDDLDFIPCYYEEAHEIVKLRKSIDSHPEQYAAHKEAIDQSYQLYLDAHKKVSDIGRYLKSLSDVAQSHGLNTPLGIKITERADRIANSPEKEHMEFVAAQQYELIRFLLEGRPFDDKMQYMYKVVEEQFGIQTEQRAYQKHEQEVYATLNQDQKDTVNSMYPEQRMKLFQTIETLQGHRKSLTASLRTMDPQMKNSNKDRRVILYLVHGAKLDATDTPINEEERGYLQEDQRRIRAYLSNDPAVSGPLLEPIVEQVLNYPYLELDIARELRENMLEFRTLLNRNVYMQNIIADHPEYFNTLPKETMDKLNDVMTLGSLLSTAVITMSGMQGLNFDNAEVAEPMPKDAFNAQLLFVNERIAEQKELIRQRWGQ